MSTQTLDLRKAREAATTRTTPPTPEKASDVPLVPREAPLPITYHAPDGNTYSEVLRSRVLSYDAKQGVARMEADLAAGRAFESMSPEKQHWIRQMAQVTFQLVDLPAWLSTWLGEDQELLNVLYGNCMAHNHIFFSDPAKGEGAQKRPRVVVDSPLVAQASALR